MQIKKLYFLYYPLMFVETTLDWALQDICKAKGIEYERILYGPGECHINIPPTDDPIVIFYIFDGKRGLNEYNYLQRNFRNAKIIQFSADTCYFMNENFYLADYFIETMNTSKEEVANIAGLENVFSFDWSISQRMIDHIDSLYAPVEKSNDFICMCKSSTHFRREFFSNVRDHFSLLTDLNEYNLDKIIEYYAKSKFTLGTTSSCLDGAPARSMKGMRDWIGCLCDSLLITDDYPQICESWPTPNYEYGNVDSLIKLHDNLIQFPSIYNGFLAEQKEWIHKNTTDIQLTKIINQIEERNVSGI